MIQDNSFIQVIRLPVNTTGWLPVYIAVIHSGAAGLLFVTAIPVLVQWLCCIAVLVHAGWLTYKLLPPFNDRVPHEVLLKPDDSWWLTDGQGHSQPAWLQPGAFIHPLLLVLRFQSPDGGKRAVIVADHDTAARVRRLRVRLKYEVNSQA